MSKTAAAPHSLSSSFQVSSNHTTGSAPAPFSLRLSRSERAELERKAGTQPLGAFIRDQLLGENAVKRRKSRKPRISDQKLSIVMSMLGQQRWASNLNQLARHANMGTLDVDDEIIEQLLEACAAMIAIRNFLLDEESE